MKRIIIIFILFAIPLLGVANNLPTKIKSVESKKTLQKDHWIVEGTLVRKFNQSGKVLQELPKLPESRYHVGLAEYKQQLWIIGGSATPNGQALATVLSIDLVNPKEWVSHLELIQGGRLDPLASVVYNELIIAGGRDENGTLTRDIVGFSPTPREGHEVAGYEVRQVLPWAMDSKCGNVTQTGQSHLLFSNQKELAVFHDVTDSWVNIGTFEEPIINGVWSQEGNSRVWRLDNGDKAALVDFDVNRNFLPMLDYLVIIIYFAGVLILGMFFAKRQKAASDFALGGQRISWWASGMSIMASGTSAVSFMAIPAMIACTSLVFSGIFPWIIIGAIVSAYVTYPLFRKLNITSTYEYLENRYGLILRLFGSGLAITSQIFARMSVVILIPSIAISALTGIPVQVSVLAIGIITTIYSSVGGFEAVIWADVVQGFLILFGLLIIAVMAFINIPGGWSTINSYCQESDKLNLFVTSFDLSLPVVWFAILGLIINCMAFANDQVTAQRISCIPLKDVRKLSFFSAIIIWICCSLVAITGILLFCFFKSSPELLEPIMQNDEMVPIFVLKKVPVGLTGLIIAGLFAASMSTISTSINTCAVLFGEDFVKRFKKDLTPKGELQVMQSMSLFSGLFGTVMAYYLINSQTPFMHQLNIELGAIFGGGFAGIFALGMFTRRTHELGAIIGIVMSGLIPIFLKFYGGNSIHWSAWAFVAVLGCMFFGYVASLIIPYKRKDLTGLTIFDQIKK